MSLDCLRFVQKIQLELVVVRKLWLLGKYVEHPLEIGTTETGPSHS